MDFIFVVNQFTHFFAIPTETPNMDYDHLHSYWNNICDQRINRFYMPYTKIVTTNLILLTYLRLKTKIETQTRQINVLFSKMTSKREINTF